MANQFNYVDWLSAETLRPLLNKLQCAQFANTSYSEDFDKAFAPGETVRINYPWRPTIRSGMGYSPQAIQRVNTTVSVDQIFGIDFEIDSVEAALKTERGRERFKAEYMDKAAAQLAQEIDTRFATFAYQNCSNVVGALGTDPTSFQTMNQARQRMVEKGCPPGGKRGIVIPPSANVSLANAAVGYFQPPDQVSRMFKEGTLGRNAGFDYYESMSLDIHTCGIWAGTVSTSSGGQSGNSLAVTCTSGDTFLKGDVIALGATTASGASFAVNPSTRKRTTSGTTMTVVVTQNVTATTTTATIPIFPTIYGPGSPYQNVDALPGNTLTLVQFPGTTSPSAPKSGKQALALTDEAFAIVGVQLESPKATEITSQTRDPETGIAVRFVRMFDAQQSKMINRFDVLLGFGQLYGDSCAVRIQCA